jgi:hypothetical protein
LLRDQALRKSAPGFIRHPPDAGPGEAEIAAFDGFWQCQTLDTDVDFVVIQTWQGWRKSWRHARRQFPFDSVWHSEAGGVIQPI